MNLKFVFLYQQIFIYVKPIQFYARLPLEMILRRPTNIRRSLRLSFTNESGVVAIFVWFLLASRD